MNDKKNKIKKDQIGIKKYKKVILENIEKKKKLERTHTQSLCKRLSKKYMKRA